MVRHAVNIGAGILLDPDRLEDMIAIVGRRGRGKTNTAVVLVEELHELGARFVVADPTGVWHGLKSSKNGKAPGIPVVVMGGEHGDVPLEETAGKVIADFVAERTSPSVILDFRGFRKGQMARFMTDFLEQLYHRNRHSLHVVLDEADQFAPQRVMGETARLVGAAEDVCKMGRAKGLLPIVITQRPAALNKNVLTQAGLLIAHQLTGPQDQKAVDDWIRANADEEQRGEFMSTIATLERGEAWFWQPEIPIFQRVHVRERKTFDSSATPKRGEKRVQPKSVAKVDLAALQERIASTIEKAKAEDPRELKRKVAELTAQLAKKEKVLAEVDARTKVIDEKLQRVTLKTVERLAVKETHVKRLEELARRCEAAAERNEGAAAALRDEAKAIRAALDAVARSTSAAASEAGAVGSARRAVVVGAGRPASASRPAPVVAPSTRRDPNPPPPPPEGAPGGGLRRMLIALAQRPGLNRRQLGLRATVSANGGSFDTYLSRGRKQGWIEGDSNRGLSITEAGLAALGSYEALPAGSALLEHYKGELGGGAARMLAALADAYPGELTRAELGERSGVSAEGGSFDTYLSRLRTLELITGGGRNPIRASDELFD